MRHALSPPALGLFALVLLPCLGCGQGGPGAPAFPPDVSSCLAAASKARLQKAFDRERAILVHAESLEGTPDDRATVQRRLARIDWRLHHRFDEGRARLRRAAGGHDAAKALLELVELETVAGEPAAAIVAATKAIDAAGAGFMKRRVTLSRDRAVVRKAVEQRLGDGAIDVAGVRDAIVSLSKQVERNFGETEAARALVRAAVLVDDGEAARLGWRSFYRVEPGRPIPNALAEAGQSLQKLLAQWRGADAAKEERIALVRAFAGTRFFEVAELVAKAGGEAVLADPFVREIVGYSRALRRLRTEIPEYYRRTALSKATRRDLDRLLSEVWTELWPKLRGTERALPQRRARRAFLEKRFGVRITVGLVGRVYGALIGHIIADETRRVEQYGYSGDMRSVVLDHMQANSFWGWVDPSRATGGWAEPGVMWEVRSGRTYLVRAWEEMQSPARRAAFLKRITALSSRDVERARENPYASLPGLRARLRLQGFRSVVEPLEARGLEGDRLREAFFERVESAMRDCSIFAHEGRHVIDKTVPRRFRPKNPETTAKMAEVAFSAIPRFVLSKFLGPSIGTATPHGRAELEVIKGFVRWMRDNHEQIAGLDLEKPLLPQADRLSDDQIREAFRAQDPLARAAAGKAEKR